MSIRRLIRESAFEIARRDVALFLQDHEEDLLKIFREEMQRLDDQIPEEHIYIDINMVGLGEAVVKSALHAVSRFLLQDFDESSEDTTRSVVKKPAGPAPLSRSRD